MKNYIQRKKTRCARSIQTNIHWLWKKINKSNGQLLLEALWLILFSCAFLAMLSHLYEKGQKEIQLSRIGGKHFSKNK